MEKVNFKWIKIVTDIFDDEKVLCLEQMPDGDSVIVIWFKLLCLAGKQNNGGYITINDKIPCNDEMLSAIFRRPLNTIRMALKAFEQFGMIEVDNDCYHIPNWNKYQTMVGAKKEYDRLYQSQRREIAATTAQDAVKPPVDDCPYSDIVKAYNTICVSYSKVHAVEGKRRAEIKGRWMKFPTLKDFEQVFRNAEASNFMKGNNSKNWKADFDWMIKPTNFQKVYENRYANSADEEKSEIVRTSFDVDDFFNAAVRRGQQK